MRNSIRIPLKRAGIAAGLVVALLQLWPVDRSNPPASAALAAPPEVEAILRRSCYDCHSNETRWPWYSYVAPVSWIVAKDVREGRMALNYSAWGRLDPVQQAKAARETVDESAEGEMPMAAYLLTHPGAHLAAGEIELLRAWAESVAGAQVFRDED
jgi:hypothetical protein